MKTKPLILNIWKIECGQFRWVLCNRRRKIICDGGGFGQRAKMEKVIIAILCGADPFATHLGDLAKLRPDIRIIDDTCQKQN